MAHEEVIRRVGREEGILEPYVERVVESLRVQLVVAQMSEPLAEALIRATFILLRENLPSLRRLDA